MSIRLIINFFLDIVFVDRKLNKTELKKAELLLYEVKDSICEFYLAEFIKEKKRKKYNEDIFRLYCSNYQFLYKNIISSKYFNHKIVSSICNNTSFYFPLNNDILDIIHSKKIKVNFLISRILFNILRFIFIIKNILSAIFYLIISLKFNFINTNKMNIIYLSFIPNIDHNKGSVKQDNFFLWVKKYFKISSKIIFVHKNNQIRNKFLKKDNYEVKYHTFLLKNFSIKNILSIIKSLILAFRLILKSKKKNKLSNLNCFIFEDLTIFFYLKINKKLKPKICLFSNIELFYRPYWTYAINKTYLYYYSSNTNFINNRKLKNKFYDLFLTKFYTWNNYICWTKEQKSWLLDNAYLSKPIINLCKFIPYLGENKFIKKSKNKIITIFDVPPKNEEDYKTFLNPYNIYSENLCIKFLDDIINNASKLDVKIIIKMKYSNKGISFKYINYLNKIEKKYKEKIIIYREKISAQSLINISDMVFSLPFSSPSIIGSRMRVKSYYYDPYNIIRHTRYNSKSVTLLNSESQLKKILQTV